MKQPQVATNIVIIYVTRVIAIGDSPRGPLNNRGKTHFFHKITQTNLQNITHTVTA
jgi:hypothetical protein